MPTGTRKQHQREQRDKADDRDRVGAQMQMRLIVLLVSLVLARVCPHSTGLIWYWPPKRSGWKMSR